MYPAPRDVDEVITLVGLDEQRDAYARALSGGQLRRLDFALALVGDPELIFLDEPTTGFDPQARRAAWQTVRSLRDLGKTVLLTTHYLDEAQALCDRVAIVKDGRILAIGAPSELGVGADARAPRDAGATRTATPQVARRRGPDAARARADAAPRSPAAGTRARADRHAPVAGGRLPRADRRRARGGGACLTPLALTWRQYRLERRMFWRNPTAAFFSFFAAAAVPRAVRGDLQRRRRTTSTSSCPASRA